MTFNIRRTGLCDRKVTKCSIEVRKAEGRARNYNENALLVESRALLVKVGVRMKGQSTLRDVRSSCGSENLRATGDPLS